MVDREKLERHYEFPTYDEAKCQKCPIYRNGDRHCGDCNECPGFKGITQLWRPQTYQKKKYYALPPGNPKKVAQLLNIDLRRAKDLRPEIPFSSGIKWDKSFKLYTGKVVNGRTTGNQKEVVNKWMAEKGGIIRCPPRFGKTVVGLRISFKLGYKTIIIANKERLLEQFYEQILGSGKYKPCSNAKQIEEKLGYPVVKIIKKMTDFNDNLDIALVLYQKFIRPGSIGRIARFLSNYSTLIVDECHGSSSSAYSKFIARLKCKYRIGLSATPKRKDGKDRIAAAFIGPTVAESNIVAMVPKIEIFETGVYSKYNHRMWVYAMKFLAKSQERKIMIVREIFKDLRNNHQGIIIPVDFVDQAKELVNMINVQAELNNRKKNEDWQEELAVLYSASIKNEDEKKAVIDNFDNGKHRVLVAIRTMIKEGVDMKSPTMLYAIVPMSAAQGVGAPLLQQLGYRISTFVIGKQQPVIKLFVDGIGQSHGCFKSLWWNEIFPNLRTSKDKPARYKMDSDDFGRAMHLAGLKEYTPDNKPGERIYSKDLQQKVQKEKAEKFARGGFSSLRKPINY